MTRPDDENINPYQAPGSDWNSPAPARKPLSKTAKRLKRFRQQCHGLGGLWVLMGLATIGLGFVIELDRLIVGGWHPMTGLAVVFDGVLGIMLGIAVCLKRMWAVTSSLLLGYVMAILWPLAVFIFVVSAIWAAAVCGLGLLILFAATAQAHRLRSLARQLESASIPLTARPEEIADAL